MKNNKKGLWGIIVAIGLFLLSKLKWVFAIFKLAKFSTVFRVLVQRKDTFPRKNEDSYWNHSLRC
ncbi:hypothetical protein [Bacillus sp. FSL K6-0268]|uniref:hypothetical protein n=1 Tax=Bacillus sp. FSL K6-0268 TaxID=2921449 RepID=UPI0030FC5C1D